MNNRLRKLIQELRERLIRSSKPFSNLAYWERRAKQYGPRAVLNLSHASHEIDEVTEKQKEEIFPCFGEALRGDERVVLDFGCGTGRFTVDLAQWVKDVAIGVDPVKTLLEMAPKDPRVEYRVMEEGEIPVPDQSVDIVWICLVLGGIKGTALDQTIREIDRVLKTDGLLFLVENTCEKASVEYWTFRQVSDYQQMFPFAPLKHLHDYHDVGERISIMAGRK